MAAGLPGWCEHCGAELLHAERRQGRARRFCGDACRQAFNREVRLRRDLMREVGLSVVQVERLLYRFRVSARPVPQTEKRDLAPSRSARAVTVDDRRSETGR